MKISNEELVRLVLAARDEDNPVAASRAFESLCESLQPYYQRLCARFSLRGYDEADKGQIFALGVWQAVRHYDPSKGSFPTYAYTAIRSHLAGVLESQLRQKRQGVEESNRNLDSHYVYDDPASRMMEEEETAELQERLRRSLSAEDFELVGRALQGEELTEQERATIRKRLRHLGIATRSSIKVEYPPSLTEVERKVTELHNQGLIYASIASKMGLTVKAVSNALERARKKKDNEQAKANITNR